MFVRSSSNHSPVVRPAKFCVKETRRITHNSIFADYLLPPSDFVRVAAVCDRRSSCDEIQNCTVKDQRSPRLPRTYKPTVEIFRTIGSPVSQKGRTSGLLPDPVLRDEHLSASRKVVNWQSSSFLKIFGCRPARPSQGEQPADVRDRCVAEQTT